MLQIFISREKAVEYFSKTLKLPGALRHIDLIVISGLTPAWYYDYQGVTYISYKANTAERLPQKPTDYEVINNQTYFTCIDGLYQYNVSCYGAKYIHSPKKVNEILTAVEAAAILGDTNAEQYTYFKVVEKATQKVVNIAWSTPQKKKILAALQNLNTEISRQKHDLQKFELDEEVTIGNSHWMAHTEKGLPCLRKIEKTPYWRNLSYR